MRRIDPTDFITVKMRERQDLQALLRDNPETIDPDLFIVDEEFSNWADSRRRVDLLGLDKEGNLVVVELKRDEEGSHMELQAIRYAAMLSAMDLDALLESHENYLQRRGMDQAQALQRILDFLEVEQDLMVNISNTPRIILIAPSFSREITTTVLWLNDRGLDIRCKEVKPYELSGELYLDIEQVIPLPSAAAYQVQIARKAREKERRITTTRMEPALNILIRHAMLLDGT